MKRTVTQTLYQAECHISQAAELCRSVGAKKTRLDLCRIQNRIHEIIATVELAQREEEDDAANREETGLK